MIALSWRTIAVLTAFFACIPLLAFEHSFFGDWNRHLAMIGYFGELLKQAQELPGTFNAHEIIGRPTPIFYGTLFLPFAGALSAVVGPRVALCAIIFALFLLQFVCVRRLIKDLTQDERIATWIAVLVTCAIYPLTNVFNRAAIPEFVAVTLLQSGVCCWLVFARQPGRWARTPLPYVAGLFLALAAGTHPLTALFGGLTIGWLWLATLVMAPDRAGRLRLLGVSAICFGLAVVVLSPWIYALHLFRKELYITRFTSIMHWFPTSLDWVGTRFSPVPYVGYDIESVTTPFLDPQINVPLLLACAILLGCVVFYRKRIFSGGGRQTSGNKGPWVVFALCVLLFAAVYLVSTRSEVFGYLPKAFEVIQFPYRLVSYLNLALLVALASLAVFVSRLDSAQKGRIGRILGIPLALAIVALGLKIPRALGRPEPGLEFKSYIEPPPAGFYGSRDYSTIGIYPKVPLDARSFRVALKVDEHHFGRTIPGTLLMPADGLLVSNIQVFPWNRLILNGKEVPDSDLRVYDGFLATHVRSGQYAVDYRFAPAPIWKGLRWFSLWALMSWALALALWGLGSSERVKSRLGRAKAWSFAVASAIGRLARRLVS